MLLLQSSNLWIPADSFHLHSSLDSMGSNDTGGDHWTRNLSATTTAGSPSAGPIDRRHGCHGTRDQLRSLVHAFDCREPLSLRVERFVFLALLPCGNRWAQAGGNFQHHFRELYRLASCLRPGREGRNPSETRLKVVA